MKIQRRKERHNKLRTNIFVSSIFFMIWSVNGYFLLGNSFKLACLFIGLLGVVLVVFSLKFNKKFISFSVKCILMLVLFWSIAYYNKQNTLDTTTIIFDIICLLLLLSGFLIGQNHVLFTKVNKYVVYLISILAVIGAYYFIQNQATIFLQGSQSVRVVNESDDGINAVGLAYVNANLFLILLFLINQQYVKKYLKIILFIGVLSCSIIIVSSGSRGALLFIGFILFLVYFSKIKRISNVFSGITKFTLILISVIGLYFLVSDYFPVLEQKVNATSKRFESMFEFVETGRGDASVNEREKLYNNFYSNLNSFILFGRVNYSPYPHNIIMEVISRWGFIIGLPLLIFFFRGFFKAFKLLINKTQNETIVYLFVYCLIFCFLQSFSSLSLEVNRMLWLCFGFIYGFKNVKTIRL
mgnify:CR=1 FL=1